MRGLVVAATLLTAAFAAAAGAADETAGIPASALEQRSSCWVLVDMDSFFCGTCLDHLLAFSRAVPARVQEERVRGILVFGGAATPEETRRKAQVVQTKWQGFSRASGIRFPASVDADMAFSGLLKAGVGLLVFDARAQTVRRFPLPVPRGGLEEILKILVD
jgi:hypothetical protein